MILKCSTAVTLGGCVTPFYKMCVKLIAESLHVSGMMTSTLLLLNVVCTYPSDTPLHSCQLLYNYTSIYIYIYI